MPNTLVYDRYRAEIVEQTRLLRGTVEGVPLTTRVPSCPEWTLRRLIVHLGTAHRWAAHLVRTRATGYVSTEQVPGAGGPEGTGGSPDADVDPEALGAWLAEGAELLSEALREAGQDTPVWTWFTEQHTGFWARRMTHETLVHRADAALTADVDFEADPDVAADCVDEWLELVSSPLVAEHKPALRKLGERAGSTLHLHATDTSQAVAAEWLISLGQDGVSWRHAHEKADVALRGPIADVLRVFFRRLPPTSDRVDVLGDAGVLDFWLDRVRFD